MDICRILITEVRNSWLWTKSRFEMLLKEIDVAFHVGYRGIVSFYILMTLYHLAIEIVLSFIHNKHFFVPTEEFGFLAITLDQVKEVAPITS